MGNYMKRRRRSTNIDITPLMDLTFMLLIIFIITVPAMEYSTDVTPPSMDTPKTVESITDKLVVTLGKQGGVTVAGESVGDGAAVGNGNTRVKLSGGVGRITVDYR